MLQPEPRSGEGCNTLSHEGLSNVNTRKRMLYRHCYIPSFPAHTDRNVCGNIHRSIMKHTTKTFFSTETLLKLIGLNARNPVFSATETSRNSEISLVAIFDLIFSKKNNKGADQSARMRRLVCAFVRKPLKTGFLALRPKNVLRRKMAKVVQVDPCDKVSDVSCLLV